LGIEETPMVRSLYVSDPYAGFTEDELKQIHAEQTEIFAEMELRELMELGEYERVKRLIERLLEAMPKRIT
jgi:hypothetical protein